ncbi:MAG: hypothetical protein K6F77_03905 [Lachnospiraceae bacterium]|nr:hypothetical protein [Lachnospiraceae bacterium]
MVIHWSDVVELYNKIYSIPPLFALFVAIVLPFAIIVVGYLISLFSEALATIIGMALAPQVAQALVNYVFFPGVMLHESAHAFLAIITGAKVKEIALFKREGNSLGHVNFENRGNVFLVAIQNIFISSAPMFIGAAVLVGCYNGIKLLPESYLWLKIIIGYIGVSMFFHMTMSSADIRVYVKGIPLFMVIVFVITLGLRFFNII